MTETLFSLVSTHGLWIVAASAYLSCLAVPIPTAIVMLTAGAFAAAGDFALWQVLAIAWTAAVLGDQTGFQIGRVGGAALVARLARDPRRAPLVHKAQQTVRTHGSTGVFFSTWLFAPLGPWVNLIAGAAGLTRWRFTLPDALGEAIWVGAYTGLGYAYGPRLESLALIVTDWSGLVMSLGLVVGLVILLGYRLTHRHPRRGRHPQP